MKKIYLVLAIASFFIGNAQINWKRSSANGNFPTWMGTGNTERGIAALNDKVYVISRKTTPNLIKVINGVDGTDVSDITIPSAVVTGGAIAINDVEVSTNGVILACNVTLTSNTSAFKVYRWDNETATPTVYINYQNTGDTANNLRLGDYFSVTGDISTSAVIFAAGKVSVGNYRVVRWNVTGGVLGAPTIITIPALTTDSGFISVTPLTISANPDFLLKAGGNTLYKYNADGTITIESIPNAVIPLSATDTKYFEAGTKKYVASYLYGTTNEYAKLVDVTNGFALASTVAVTPVLGTVANGNAAGGVGVKVIPDLVDGTNNTVSVYVLGCNNGISGTTLLNTGVPLGNKDLSALEKRNMPKVFPNPASNEFYIAIDTELEKGAQALIYDIQGRQVKSAKIEDNVQTINIQDLNAGEYLVKIENGSYNTTAKLLKK